MKRDGLTCEAFRARLRPLLDSELSARERDAMDGHRFACADCAEELEAMTRILTLCAELDEGVEIPAAASAAWRNAIRGQRRRRVPGFGALAGGLALVAAVAIALTASVGGPANPSGPAPSALAGAAGRVYYDAGVGGEVYIARDEAGGGGEAPMGLPGAAAEAYVARSAELRIETADFDGDLKRARDVALEYGARFERTFESEGEGGARLAIFDMRLPRERLDDMVSALGAVGRIASRETRDTDLTAQIVDARLRKASIEARILRLNELMAEAESLSEIVAIEARLLESIGELDALSRPSAELEEAARYATARLEIHEAAAESAREGAPLSERAREGYGRSEDWLRGFYGDAVACIAANAYQIALGAVGAALAAWALRAILKRRK